MEILKTAPRPSTRLNRGNVLLANAQKVNTDCVKVRLDFFADAHRNYMEAQAEVEQADDLERAELRTIEELGGALEKAMAGLQAALLMDGEPRRNPFGRFSDRAIGQISSLPIAEKAKAMHDVTATIRRSLGLSKATFNAAGVAEKAALAIDTALPGWELRRSYLITARQTRDAIGGQWDKAYRALRLLAAAMDGDLYVTLFPRRKRGAKKAKAAKAPNQPDSAASTAAEVQPGHDAATSQDQAPERMAAPDAPAPNSKAA